MPKLVASGKKRLYIRVFFAAYFMYIVVTFLDEIKAANILLQVASIICLLLAYISALLSLKKADIRRFLLVLILLIISTYLVIAIYANNPLIFLAPLAFTARNIDQRKIIKNDLLLKTLLVVSIMIMSFVGITQIGHFTRFGENRYSLGFHHPNYAGAMLLNIYLDIMFLQNKKKLLNLIIAMPFLAILTFVIDSRNAAIGMIIALIMQLMQSKSRTNKSNKSTRFPAIVMLILICVSLSFIILPATNQTSQIDALLSGRIGMAKSFYSYYGIGLFGNHFKKYGIKDYNQQQFYVLDNAYLHLLIRYGIIVTAMFMFFYVIKLKRASNNKTHTSLFGILITYALIGLVEQSLYQPIKNPFMLLSGKDEEKKVENKL